MPFMNTQRRRPPEHGPLGARPGDDALQPERNMLVGINGTKSGGFANILGAGPSQVKLALDLNIWTVDPRRGRRARATAWARSRHRPVRRSTNRILDPYDTNCRQAWTGYTHNVLHAVTGGDKNSLRIAPAFTLDRRLRIAKITFGSTGVTTHNTVRACLQPFSPYVKQGTRSASSRSTSGRRDQHPGRPPVPASDERHRRPRLELDQGRRWCNPRSGHRRRRPVRHGWSLRQLPGRYRLASGDATNGAELPPVPGTGFAVSRRPADPHRPRRGSRRYPYNFHRSPGIEAATCSYDV